MQFREYLIAISKRWWIVVLVALSATVCSYFFTKLQPPVYRSSLQFVNSARLEWGTTMSVQVLLRQQEEQLKTLSMASKVNERMGLGMAPGEIAGKIMTKAYPDAIILRLDVEDQDAERARKIALGYGLVFEEEKAAEYALADPENRVRVTMLEEPRPGTLIRPSTKMNTIAGAILGLILGLAMVMILEYLDDTLKTARDVARELGLVTLGTIPRQ
ncbi:MAG: YveK family protein [Chloroflexota bacterium]